MTATARPGTAEASGVHPAAMIHDTAEVHPSAHVGARTRVWHQTQIGEGVRIGEDCVLGKGVHVTSGAVIGDRVKVQNGCGVFGARLADEVMLAPGVYLLEDPTPRAAVPHGQPKGRDDWTRHPVSIAHGATVGANAVVAPGVSVGRYALIAIGSAVHRGIADHALVAGNPARQVGWVCRCGHRLDEELSCPPCRLAYRTEPSGLVIAQPNI